MEQPERKLDLKRAVSINEALDAVPDIHLAPLVDYIEQLESRPQGEAVAWRWRLEGMWRPGEFSYGPSEPMSERPPGWTIEPLYLAPAAETSATAAEVERLEVKILAKVDKLKLHMQDYHQMHDHERDLRIAAEKERDTYKESWERLSVEKALSSWGEFQRLRNMLTDANDEIVRLQTDIASAIGTTRYMDSPDGGSVTLAEQVRRMRADVEGLTMQRDELEAQVKRLLAKEGGRIGDQLVKEE